MGNDTFLVGQDGWADGRLGNYYDSQIVLNDSKMIADLFQAKILGRSQLLAKMQQLADHDAEQLQMQLMNVYFNQTWRFNNSLPTSVVTYC